MVLTGLIMLGMPYVMVTLLSWNNGPFSCTELEKPGPTNSGGVQEPTRKDYRHSEFPTKRGCQVWARRDRDCLWMC